LSENETQPGFGVSDFVRSEPLELSQLADAIRDRAARCGRIGRLVGLELARTFVSAFGKVPILELADEARREHPRPQRSCGGRDAEAQLVEGLLLAAALVIDHQMTAGRDDLAHNRDEFILDARDAGSDRRAVDFDRRIEAAFDPRFHVAPARAYDRGHRGPAPPPAFFSGDSDVDENPSDALAKRPDFIQDQRPAANRAALEPGRQRADQWSGRVHRRTIASPRISDINISVFRYA